MSAPSPESPQRICPECGKDNRCTGNETCWCMNKPRVFPVPADGACRCERCLDAALAAQAGEKAPVQRQKN